MKLKTCEYCKRGSLLCWIEIDPVHAIMLPVAYRCHSLILLRKISSGYKCLSIGLSLSTRQCVVYASSEGSVETAQMHGLV